MNNFFVILLMIFCHIVDDYYLQGILASMKQKKWWKENAPQKLYENDYLCALLMHGLSWSFMIMLPIAVAINFNVDINFFLMFIINAVFHAAIDDLKANKYRINLWTDQILHIVQIFGTAFILLKWY